MTTLNATLHTWFGIEYFIKGERGISFGNPGTRGQVVNLPGLSYTGPKRVQIAKDSKALLFDENDMSRFTFFMARIVDPEVTAPDASGSSATGTYATSAYLAYAVGQPTDAANGDYTLSTSVTDLKQNIVSLSCYAPFILTTDLIDFNATDATWVGSEADGSPTLWTVASPPVGKIYRVWARNPDAAKTLLLEWVALY